MSSKEPKNKSKGPQSTGGKKTTAPEPKRDLKRLESELEKAKKDYRSLAKELERCRFDLVTLQKNFNYDEVRKALPQMMDIDGLRAEQCAGLVKDIAELRRELEVLRKNNGTQELQTENEPFKTKQTGYDKPMTGMKELQTENEHLKTKLREYENEMARNLKEEHALLKSKLTELQKKMTMTEAEKPPLNRELSEQRAVSTTIPDKKNEQIEAPANQANKVTKPEKEKDQLERHRSQDERELTESKKQETVPKSKLEALEKLYKDEKGDKERKLSEANDQIKRLESRLVEMTNSNDKENSIKKLSEANDQIKRLESRLVEMTNSNDKENSINKELTETKEELRDLNSEFEKMKQMYEDEKREKERTGTDLNSKIKSQDDSLERLQKELKEEKRNNKKLQEQMSNMRTGTEREKDLSDKIEDLKTRLSELASAKLMTNNPHVADLSDSNRPTKLAEQYSDLYDNEWTNVYEILDRTGLPEVKVIQTLRGILVDSFKFCAELSKEQTKQLKFALTTFPRSKEGEPIADDSIIPTKLRQLRELRKAFAPDVVDGVFQSYKKERKPKDIDKVQVRDYIHKCITLSWFMSVQDPPVVIDTENHTGNFDSNIFRTYTKTGKLIDYVVWPPLYLHDGGSMLCKGVAQGK